MSFILTPDIERQTEDPNLLHNSLKYNPFIYGLLNVSVSLLLHVIKIKYVQMKS